MLHRELPQLREARAELSYSQGAGETRGLLPAGFQRVARRAPAGSHPFVLAYLGISGTALGRPLQPQVPPRWPAELGAAPQESRGGCADAEGARKALSALPPALARWGARG